MEHRKTIPEPVAQAINALLATCGTNLQALTETKPDQIPGQLLRVKEAAKRLGVSIPTLYRLINTGKLKPVYIGEACTRIPETQIIQIAGGSSCK